VKKVYVFLSDTRPPTADGRPRNGRWTVDRGRWVGQAFQPVREGKPSTNRGTNKRMGDRRRRMAGGRHPRRIGFPACQKTASERGARKNFVTLLSWRFILFSPRRHEDTKVEKDRQRIGERINEWGPQTADGRRRNGRGTLTVGDGRAGFSACREKIPFVSLRFCGLLLFNHKDTKNFFFLGEKESQTEGGFGIGAGVLVGLPLPEHQGLLEQRAWGTQVSPQ
jgi:hypothetical protein